MKQLDLFEDNDRCQHGVSQRNGGWTFEPVSRLWVHADPECRLPKHHQTQSLKPKEATVTQSRPWLNPLNPESPVMMAIDPGDVHAGVAFFHDNPELDNGMACHWAGELDPDACTDLLAELAISNLLHTVVFERFRLYADKAAAQRGSEFDTSQMIGVIKWICRHQNAHAEAHRRARTRLTENIAVRLSCIDTQGDQDFARNNNCTIDSAPQQIKVVGQMADIKRPTRGICRHLGIRSWANAHRNQIHKGGKACAKNHCHAVDAELHGWRWHLRGTTVDVEDNPIERR